MGCFSRKFSDVPGRLIIGKRAIVPIPPCFQDKYGVSQIKENSYDGHGRYGCYDIYDLVADWNREFLSQNPDLYLPGQEEVVSNFPWYPFYADLSLSPEDIDRKMHEITNDFEYRYIGIAISCYDEDNEKMKYPIKICKFEKNAIYDNLPASKRDPMQGCY